MNRDVEYLIDRLSNQEGTNQCVVSYGERCCKIKREDYTIVDGVVTFNSETSWSDTGYSVSEMLEFLNLYKSEITEVLFIAYDNSVQRLLNVFEVDNIGSIGEFSCMINVGDPSSVLKLHNNPDNQNYSFSSLKHYNMY